MSTPGITYELLDGRAAADREQDLLELSREVYGADVAGDEFARQLRVWCRQPGFALAAAWHGGYLVGYACGMPLRPSTSWWKDVTTDLPPGLTEERPGRTFALTQLLVRAPWRRQWVATALYDLLFADRKEERATCTLPPTAQPAQAAFRNWGWQKIARTRSAGTEAPVLDVLVTTLR